jgi:ribosome-associated protein
MIPINHNLSLPEEEIHFTFTRSGGPGGQNVNKVNTRATLWFDLDGSASLTPYQKQKIHRRLAGRINNKGQLQVVAAEHRTQKANREAALQRFSLLLASALTEPKARKKTRLPAGAKERRLQAKKKRGQLKSSRSPKKYPE